MANSGSRALRQQVRKAWGLSPRELRDAARLHRTVTAWDRIRSERLARAPCHRRKAIYHRAWREHRAKHERLRELLSDAPPRTKRLIAGELDLPTAPRVAERPEEFARQHVEDLQRSRVQAVLSEAA